MSEALVESSESVENLSDIPRGPRALAGSSRSIESFGKKIESSLARDFDIIGRVGEASMNVQLPLLGISNTTIYGSATSISVGMGVLQNNTSTAH